jgi:hypothetical protein
LVADYAEQHGVYHGTHGVCAGPQALIDEYLRVLLEGQTAPIQAQPDVASRLGDLNAAIDYGLHGQRIEALTRFFGASQGLLHERLRAAFRDHAGPDKMRELVDMPVDTEHYPLLRTAHSLAETFQLELLVNRWLFVRAGDALPFIGRDSIDTLMRLDPAAQKEAARSFAALFARACPELAEPLRDDLAAIAADAFALERCCLHAVASEQERLNARLRRPPGRALTRSDLALYTKPRFGPPIEDTLVLGLGLSQKELAACIPS